MPLRAFSTREGEEWRVWSVVPEASAAITLDEEFRQGWLCFEEVNGGKRRRLTLTEAPAGWEALPDDRLDLLRRVAMVVGAAPADPGATITSRRPIENAALYRRPVPPTIVDADDDTEP